MSSAVTGPAPHHEGILDTNLVAAFRDYDTSRFPDRILVTAITLGELSFAPHATDDPLRRARRIAVLQHVEHTFDVLPYDEEAARSYGQICAAVLVAGRKPRGRAPDLMIAAIAAANDLTLYTANVADFKGLDELVDIIGVDAVPNSL